MKEGLWWICVRFIFIFIIIIHFINIAAMDNVQQRASIFVKGKVQGVFMRKYTQEKARGLGLSGWCRNIRAGKKAGQVEIEAQGPAHDVQALLDWINAGGSPGATVDEVLVTFIAPVENESDFIIRK